VQVHAHRLTSSFEAIDVQKTSQLFNSLQAIFLDSLSEKVNILKGHKKFFKDASATIFKQTGILVTLKLDERVGANAYVLVPNIDRNHPLLIDWYREISDNSDGLKAIKQNKGLFTGAIDRQKSKVSGGFSNIPVDVFLTYGLFKEAHFTAAEITAILLHELGHVFTYLEYLGTNLTTNYVLQHISRSLLNTRELKRKYEIVEEGCDLLEIDLENPDALAKAENETVIQTVILQAIVEKRYSELNSKTYDMTAWEMLSDQFATRHGAGRAMVTGLDKIFRLYGAAEYRGTAGYLAVEALKLLFTLAIGAITFMLIPFLLVFVIDPSEDLYDKPKSRMLRIRRDMVDALKDKTLEKNHQKQLIQDIEIIDRVVKELTERRTFIQFFWTNTWSKSRHNYKQLQFQQELEMLVNNELFVKAAQIETIAL
jgi:hypothetical protein